MVKKITALLLVFMLIFALTACGSGTSGGGKYISCIQINNTVAESYEPAELMKDKGEKDHFYSLKISGLVDKTVEDKVNASINSSIEEFREAGTPDYKGIENVSSGTKTGVTITASAKGSLNNVLSVLLTKTVYYKEGAWTDTRTLNYNLNDGELISFEDIFCKESEPGDALSAACMPFLKENNLLEKEGEPKYTEDQKFYLALDGIHVIYDYATGGVISNDLKPVDVVVGYNSVYKTIDIDQYLSAECIFENDNISKNLVPSGSELVESENNIPDRTNLAMIQYLSWPEDIPDQVLNAFMDDANVSDEEIEAVSNIVFAGSGVYFYNDMANCTQVGNYFNIVRSKSLFGAGIFTEDKYCSVYDKKGNRITLEDLFVNGVEYKKIISEELKKSLANYYKDDTYAGKTLDEVYNGLSFYLDATGIGLWTEGLGLKNDNGDKHESSVNFFIEYDVFGCENMTIFD